MDVRQWLENTADREPPDEDERAVVARHLGVSSKPEASPQYRCKRKRASSDSSIIHPRPLIHGSVHADNQAHVAGGFRAPEYARAMQHSLDGSQSCESAKRSPPGAYRAYERRPRHKTKTDRYDPNAKRKRTEHKGCGDAKVRSTRRKSHRSGDGFKTTGLVQGFQIKNGPNKSRLTLKPDVNAGIFKHGRASAQVAGRGSGLPDLVFNEMRFLQRPRDHQDELPGERDESHTTKQGREKHDHEEISAYFAKADFEAAGPTVHAPPTLEARDSRSNQHTARRESRKEVAKPPVDLPEKTFLGFGSKGATGESKATARTDNSYFTWSESAVLPPRPKPRDYSSGPFFEVARVTRAEEGAPGKSSQHHNAVKHPDHAKDMGEKNTWTASRRVRGLAVVEMYQAAAKPDAWCRRSRSPGSRDQHPTMKDSQHLSSEAASSMTNQRQSFNTSDILKVRQPHTSSHYEERTHMAEGPELNDDDADNKENRDPAGLSPTTKLLQQAQRAVDDVTTADNNGQKQRCAPEITGKVRQRAHKLDHATRARYHLSIETNEQHERSTKSPALPQRRLQTASTLKTGQDRWPQKSRLHQPHEKLRRRTAGQPAIRRNASADGEMLDDQPDAPPIDWLSHHAYASTRQVEDLVLGRPNRVAPGLYQAQAECGGTTRSTSPRRSNSFARMSDAMRSQLSGRGRPARTPSIRGLSIEKEFEGDQFELEGTGLVTDGCAATDELAGFWKPQRLY